MKPAPAVLTAERAGRADWLPVRGEGLVEVGAAVGLGVGVDERGG